MNVLQMAQGKPFVSMVINEIKFTHALSNFMKL